MIGENREIISTLSDSRIDLTEEQWGEPHDSLERLPLVWAAAQTRLLYSLSLFSWTREKRGALVVTM